MLTTGDGILTHTFRCGGVLHQTTSWLSNQQMPRASTPVRASPHSPTRSQALGRERVELELDVGWNFDELGAGALQPFQGLQSHRVHRDQLAKIELHDVI